MIDVAEQVGRTACSALQEEFSPDDVMFIPTDVTQSKQLVSSVKVKSDCGLIQPDICMYPAASYVR